MQILSLMSSEYISRFQAVEISLVTKSIDADTAKFIAKEATHRYFAEEDHKVNKTAPNLCQFTKLEDDINPETFIEQLYGELRVANLDTV